MIKNKLALIFSIMLLCSCVTTPLSKKNPTEYLQKVSTTILFHSNPKSGGSGIIIERGGWTYVLITSHVIEDYRKTLLMDLDKLKDGEKPKVTIRFEDVIYSYQRISYPDGSVHELSNDLEVVKYSPYDEYDLSLLRFKNKSKPEQSAVFYLEDNIPNVLTPVYHVGSYMGKLGANSFSSGVISRVNVKADGDIYDQSTCVVYPGSSGGGIFLSENLKCIGVADKAIGESFNFFIPVRHIEKWAKEEDIEWLIDPSVPYKHIESGPIIKDLSIGILMHEIRKQDILK